MLTDIFAFRYKDTQLWREFDESARRLLVQGFRIISEQVFPYYDSAGKERSEQKEKWDQLNKRLAMELGLRNLSDTVWSYPDSQGRWMRGTYPKVTVCENFVCAKYDHSVSPDQFIKERLSFIEIAFRCRSEEIAKLNADLPNTIEDAQRRSSRGRGHRFDGIKSENRLRAWNETINSNFRACCDELNERFRQAGTKLDYHNGFIQLSSDETTVDQIDRPFWRLTSLPKWQNVDLDMKTAFDLRDSGKGDPAFHSAKALESVIKIISDENGWSTGKEKGAYHYLNQLHSKKNGQFINGWEHECLTKFFSSVRNPFGHGPGSADMPTLSPQQTDWAIEFCMSWAKNLIRRM